MCKGGEKKAKLNMENFLVLVEQTDNVRFNIMAVVEKIISLRLYLFLKLRLGSQDGGER